MEQHHKHHSESHTHHQIMEKNEINISLSYKNNLLSIYLEDKEGKAPELEMTHEKFIHLIVVSEDLNEYFHLHPNQVNSHKFEQKIDFTGHSYRAFVDINPKGKGYVISPIPFQAKSASHMYHNDVHPVLRIDQESKKEIQGKRIELIHDAFQVDKDIQLTFNIENAIPEPYLGALGHVVIIDDEVKEFIHVHPISDEETVFMAHFSKPGIYKLWAEFKFDEEVHYFPYVIEVS